MLRLLDLQYTDDFLDKKSFNTVIINYFQGRYYGLLKTKKE